MNAHFFFACACELVPYDAAMVVDSKLCRIALNSSDAVRVEERNVGAKRMSDEKLDADEYCDDMVENMLKIKFDSFFFGRYSIECECE